MVEDYYLRDLTIDDWTVFNVMDKKIFPEEPVLETSYPRGLSGLKTSSVVAVDKESKEFLGYYRIAIYGKEGHIQRIGVHPDHWRKGIGSDLLKKCMLKLNTAGCTKYFLYVKEDNIAAINLYKKFGLELEEKSWQFIVPYKMFPEKSKGKCRHVEWGEIQMISLRFNLNPIRIQQYFGRENEHVLVFEVMGQQLGFGRFNPNFPGAMPFILRDPKYILDFVGLFKEFVTNPKFDAIKITFDDQERLAEKLHQLKVPMNYELLKMSRETQYKEE